jgi:hypothetical protein
MMEVGKEGVPRASGWIHKSKEGSISLKNPIVISKTASPQTRKSNQEIMPSQRSKESKIQGGHG